MFDKFIKFIPETAPVAETPPFVVIDAAIFIACLGFCIIIPPANNPLTDVLCISNFENGDVVPMPMLVPSSKIKLFPIVVVPVNLAT